MLGCPDCVVSVSRRPGVRSGATPSLPLRGSIKATATRSRPPSTETRKLSQPRPRTSAIPRLSSSAQRRQPASRRVRPSTRADARCPSCYRRSGPGWARGVQNRELDRSLFASWPCRVVHLEPVVAGRQPGCTDRLTVECAAVRAVGEIRPGPVSVLSLEVEVEVSGQGRCRTTLQAVVVVHGIYVELEVLARHTRDALAGSRRLRDDRPLDR